MAQVIRMGAMVLGFLVLVPMAARAADERAIAAAIDRGVTYLRELQQPDGTWPRQEIGATALAALTLLDGVVIGLAQALAIVPGTSRSGSTSPARLSSTITRTSSPPTGT